MNLRWVERRSAEEKQASVSLFDEARLGELGTLVGTLGRADWLVDLVMVGDLAMTDLNREFRHVDSVTDVLSFSYLLDRGSSEPDLKTGQGYAYADLWLDPLGPGPDAEEAPAVGEVVLAPAFVTRRCLDNGWPLEHEMPLLVVHGIMHILGWDHQDLEQTEAMQLAEEAILAAGGLPHPLRRRS